MFTIERDWSRRLSTAVMPEHSSQAGWLIDGSAEPAFVEPTLRIVNGDPQLSRLIVVAAPGAVGKSTYARTLGAATRSVVIDLARTDPLGGNFFVGGLANAFGHEALTNVAKGSIGLIVDALDEAQLRSGGEGFAAGLLDLGKLVQQRGALPATLFGRAAAAEEAWLVLDDAGYNPALLEIEFFDEEQALNYLGRKLPVLAASRQETRVAFERHSSVFSALAVDTRAKLVGTPGGSERRFAGYAPVLDAICAYALDDDALNPSARSAKLSATGPVALVGQIATSILDREQGKLVQQLLKRGFDLTLDEQSKIYSPKEQLSRIAATMFGAPSPPASTIADQKVRDAYDEMVADFAPQHPFIGARGHASNAAFAAYVLVWAITKGYSPELARRALNKQPTLGSGLFFELYMDWLKVEQAEGEPRRLDLSDVGLLFASFASQANQGEQPTLDVLGEWDGREVEVDFEMLSAEEGEEPRSYGPFTARGDEVIEFRTPVGGLHIAAPVSLIVGDGRTINITAPVEIEVMSLDLEGKELRVFKSLKRDLEQEQVSLIAEDVSVSKVERIMLHAAKLSVTFPGSNMYPWVDYAQTPSAAPNDQIAELRRRARRILTSFRSHSKGALRRIAAKVDNTRIIKNSITGPALLSKFKRDSIITSVNSGKFYELNPDKLAASFDMDYQAIQQQQWTSRADAYLLSSD